MTQRAIDPMPDFRGPSALGRLTQFRQKFGVHIERRIQELRKQADAFMDADPTPDLSRIYAELDSLHYFEPELHRLIQAFVEEAVKPMRDFLIDVYARPIHLSPAVPAASPTAPPAERLPGHGDPLS